MFYGIKNTSTLHVKLSDIDEHDTTGTLILSILGINTPGSFKDEDAEGMGLLAACVGAGLLGTASLQEAQKVLQNISPHERAECLRYALVFACQEGQQQLVNPLFELGEDPNVTSMDDESMPLEIAKRRRDITLAKILLDHGAGPNLELTSGLNCKELANMIDNKEFLRLFDRL